MGKQKYLHQVNQFIRKSPIISYRSIENLVNDKKKVKQYTKQLIRNLVKQKKLFPLIKGYYANREEISLAVLSLQPAYLGLQDAISHHGLWEQETIPIIITIKSIRTGIRKVMGKNILIRRIEPRYFFGIEYYPQEDYALPYSDVEKTLIDMVHFNQKIDEEVIKEFRKRVNQKQVLSYLRIYPVRTKEKVKKILKITF